MRRQVACHGVDVVGEVFPGACDTRHDGLSAQLSFGSDFAGDAADFGCKCVELIHHGVDRVFQLQNLAFNVDGDFAGEIATCDGSRDFRDVADLRGEVCPHCVHGVGQVFPRSSDIGHVGAAAEFAFGSDFTGDAEYFRCESIQLIDHRVDRVFELEDFAFNVHRDFA